MIASNYRNKFYWHFRVKWILMWTGSKQFILSYFLTGFLTLSWNSKGVQTCWTWQHTTSFNNSFSMYIIKEISKLLWKLSCDDESNKTSTRIWKDCRGMVLVSTSTESGSRTRVGFQSRKLALIHIYFETTYISALSYQISGF